MDLKRKRNFKAKPTTRKIAQRVEYTAVLVDLTFIESHFKMARQEGSRTGYLI